MVRICFYSNSFYQNCKYRCEQSIMPRRMDTRNSVKRNDRYKGANGGVFPSFFRSYALSHPSVYMLQTVQHTKLPQSESERKSDPYQHQKSSDDDQYKPDQPFAGALLPEHEVRKRDGDEDAQFINRNDDARKPVMQGFVIAEP